MAAPGPARERTPSCSPSKRPLRHLVQQHHLLHLWSAHRLKMPGNRHRSLPRKPCPTHPTHQHHLLHLLRLWLDRHRKKPSRRVRRLSLGHCFRPHSLHRLGLRRWSHSLNLLPPPYHSSHPQHPQRLHQSLRFDHHHSLQNLRRPPVQLATVRQKQGHHSPRPVPHSWLRLLLAFVFLSNVVSDIESFDLQVW